MISNDDGDNETMCDAVLYWYFRLPARTLNWYGSREYMLCTRRASILSGGDDANLDLTGSQ